MDSWNILGNFIKMLLVLIALAIGYAWYKQAVAIPYTYSPYATTGVIVESIYLALPVVKSHTNVTDLIGKNHSYLDINRQLTSCMRKWHLDVYVKEAKTNDFLTLDAWGNPIIVLQREDLPAKASSRLRSLAETNDFIIWSAGPNGTNEWGYGDDYIVDENGNTPA